MQPTPDRFAAPKVRVTLVQVKRFVLFAVVAAAIVLPTWSEVAALQAAIRSSSRPRVRR